MIIKLGGMPPTGCIWTMSAGSGASVIYSGAITAADFAHELIDYSEHSGAPSEGQTFDDSYISHCLLFPLHLTNLHLVDLTHTLPCPDGKILIIGDGIADFTNVAATLKGIVRTLTSYKTQLIARKAKIYVRRGIPDWQEGLKAMCLLGESIPHVN
jgi:ATP citrate (pro-S)-lyase